MDRTTEIAILSTAFEPHGAGFLFYRNRSSLGVPVSAKERDAYLAMAGFWERWRWTRKVVQRPATVPRRNVAQASRRLRAAMPRRFIVSALAFTALFVALALGSDTAIWLRAVFALVAIFFATSAIVNIRARLGTTKSD
ncbi:MAG: hypothetical protein JHD35_07285 [Sphingopyxis sp.]|nr:hypothetical protein [Sphingopyxis sp.]